MDWYYLYYVSPNWGYMSLETHVDLGKAIISYFLQISLILAIDWKNEDISGNAVQILYMVMMTPLLSYYALNDQSTLFTVFCVISFLITSITVRIFPKVAVFRMIRFSKNSRKIFSISFIIFVLAFVVIIIRMNGLNLGTLNIFNSELIYQIRAEGNGVSGALAYVYGWIYRIFIPLFTAYCMYKKKVAGVVFAVAISLGMYLSDPHKEIILGIALVILICFFGRKIKYGLLMMAGFISAIGAGMVFYLILDSKAAFLGLDIIMRVFHIPASIKFLHYRYFSEFPKLYFSEGSLGRLFGISYPYSMSVGRVIGMHFKGVDTNNNAGYIAYAFDDLGFPGMILAAVLLAVVLRCMDLFLTSHNRKWVTAAMVYMIIGLNDAGFLQWLLSGGAMVAFIALNFIASYEHGHAVGYNARVWKKEETG